MSKKLESEGGCPGRPPAVPEEESVATFVDISPSPAAYRTTVTRYAEDGWSLLAAETIRGGSIRLHFIRKASSRAKKDFR